MFGRVLLLEPAHTIATASQLTTTLGSRSPPRTDHFPVSSAIGALPTTACSECLHRRDLLLSAPGLRQDRQRVLVSDGVRRACLPTVSFSENALIALAKESYTADPKYKKYAQQVDRCLNSFDNVQEWADCIAFIKQLLKVRTPVNLHT